MESVGSGVKGVGGVEGNRVAGVRGVGLGGGEWGESAGEGGRKKVVVA